MAGCHNSPRGAFLLLLSLLPVPPPPSLPPRRRSCYACIGGQFLKVEISSSHCINDERSQPAKRWKPHGAALYMGCRRAPPHMCATLAARCEYERECAHAATASAAAMRRPRATVVMMKTIVEKNGKFSVFTYSSILCH